jgi:hypothetical protein
MWEINYTTIVAAVMGAAATLLVNKMAMDLLPKGKWFTGRRIFYSALTGLVVWSVFKLVSMIVSGDILASTLASMFLVTFGCITLVAVACLYLIVVLNRRVDAIEKHVFRSNAR